MVDVCVDNIILSESSGFHCGGYVMPCSVVQDYWHFEGMPMNFYTTTLHHISVDSILKHKYVLYLHNTAL